jgi:hypothetical protein
VVRGTSGKFDPQAVTKEYAALCRDYHIRSVVGDNYAQNWVTGAWRSLGFEYIRSPQPKGANYLESLPVFTRGLARLPDHARLVRELRLLERRTHRVEHPRNGHDDFANVVCGVFHLLTPAIHEHRRSLLVRRGTCRAALRSCPTLLLRLTSVTLTPASRRVPAMASVIYGSDSRRK